MSSSGRDLIKAINGFIASPKLPLPDDLTRVIEAYLDKHTEYDQATSDRLHDELQSTFNRSVRDEQSIHYASFLSVLRHLRPAIRSQAHVLEWWEKLVEPVLDHLGQKRGSNEILDDVGNFLVPDEEDSADADESQDNTGAPANPIATHLLQKWMEANQAAQTGGFSEGWTKAKPIQDTILVFGKRKPMAFFNTLNTFFVQKHYRTSSIGLLSEFVRSQPPHLHIVIKSPLFESLLRCLQFDTSTTVVSLALTALIMLLPNMPSSIVPVLPTLFNIYARLLFWEREALIPDEKMAGINPPEQYASNPLWEKCQYSPDHDGMNIHHLLGYFTILYGLYPLNFMDYIRKPQRYLRHANATDADDVEVQPSEIRGRSEPFRRCHLLHPNFYNLTIESEKTDFGRWMRSATADVVSECLALHVPMEQFYVHHDSTANARRSEYVPMSAEDGQPEPLLGQSMTLDAAGDSARDMRLSTSTGAGSPLLSSRAQSVVVRRSSQSSFPSDAHAPDVGGDSPTLPPLLSQSASRADLQELIDSNKAIKTRLHQSLANDSVPSLSLSQHELAAEQPPPAFSKIAFRTSSASAQSFRQDAEEAGGGGPTDRKQSRDDERLMQMQRHILLLQNDLIFERHMVHQHLAHIGAMQRQNVKQAVTEAETQNLLLANRTLKHRLEEAKKAETQVKKEAEMSRTRAKNWEESLATRLKKLREEHKRWTAEEATLQTDLKNAVADNNRLVKLVCEKEVRELKLEQDMRVLEAGAAEKDRLDEKVKRLVAAEQENRQLEAQLKQARDDTAKVENMLALLYMKLDAQEAEFHKTRSYYQQQVAVLNAKLTEALRSGRPAYGATSISNLADTRALVESALAASRAKHLELQKNHTRLTRKYKVLESKMLERATMYDDQLIRSDMSVLSDPETEASGIINSQFVGGGGSSSNGAGSVGSGGSGGAVVRHRRRVASDAGSAEATSPAYWGPAAVSTSLGSAVSAASASNTASRRSSTPSGQPAHTGSTSPQTERYYGRGGVQNTARKERKEKKKDETDKGSKKGGAGIRGIRGFGI